MSAEGVLLAAKRAGRRAGLEVLRFNPTNALDAQRSALMSRHDVDLVIDGGANAGQWARLVRAGGYGGALVSFEPVAEAFTALAAAARGDARWEARRLALDAAAGEAEVHVAGNSWSSSLLEMEAAHLRVAPESAYVGTEQVPVARLDEVELPAAERIWLKLDVQGAELRALQGSERLLERVALVEVELSLRPLYVGAPLWPEVAGWLEPRGYRLVGVAPSLVDDRTAELLQVNGVYLRSAG
jgi:FkbM family methyltransferase